MASPAGDASLLRPPTRWSKRWSRRSLTILQPKRGGEAILFVNGFGGTPLIELYLLYHEAARMIEAAGLKPRGLWSAPT